MADSGTATDSNTAIVENGSDPPDVSFTKVLSENRAEGGDASKAVKKDEEENKNVDELKGVVEENKGHADLKDGVDVKDVEEAKDVQIKMSVDENSNEDERDSMTTKDGEGKKDLGEVKDSEGTEDGEEKKEVGVTKESNKKKEIVETMYLEGHKDANEARDEPDKKDGGETKEVEGKEDVIETMQLELQKDAKEGDENEDAGKEKVFGDTSGEEGKKVIEENKHHDEKRSVKGEVKAKENNVTEVRKDTGDKNNVQVSDVKDDVEMIDSDVKGTGQKEIVEEGKVHKDDNSVEQLKDRRNKQALPGVNDDEQKRDMGDENNAKNISKIVKSKEVKAKKKPKESLKVEAEDLKKKVADDVKDKNNVFISGSEEGKEDGTGHEDVHEEEDHDEDVEKKSGSKKVATSYKKKRFRGERTKNKGEEKGKNEAEEKESEEKSNELSTPIEASSPSLISSRERPVRERKNVERLVEVIEKEPNKTVIIEKGRGTPLKDIPNVAYKVARKKPVDLKFLHQTLFGRRGKVVDFKNHILQFSGFAWHETEEKQRAKIKEKLDKCVKDDLLDLCDLLDLTVSKTSTKKEEIIVKLVDFLEAPHATTDALLAEKDQSEKSRKRKRSTEGSASRSSGGTAVKKSRKGRAKSDGRLKSKGKTLQDTKDEDEEEDTENGIPDDEDDARRHSESDAKENESSEASDDQDKIEDDNDDDYGKGKRDIVQSPQKQSSAIRERRRTGSDTKKVSLQTEAKSPVKTTPSSYKNLKVKKDDTGEKVFTRRKKKVSESPEASDEEGGSEDVDDHGKRNQDIKQSPKQEGSSVTKKRKRMGSNSKKSSSHTVVKRPVKTTPSSKQSKIEKDDTGEKVFTRKKKDTDSPKKSNSKSTSKDNSSGKKSGKGKATSGEQRKSGPNKLDLRKTICEILKEVDFNTATFTDILKKLAAHYKMDLTSKKAAIKQMIQEELTKMADEAEDSEDEGDTEDAGKEENPKPAAKKVKA